MQQPNLLRKTPFNPLRNCCPVHPFPRCKHDPIIAWRQHLWSMLHSDASTILQKSVHYKTLEEEPLASDPNRELDSMYRYPNWNPRCIHEHWADDEKRPFKWRRGTSSLSCGARVKLAYFQYVVKIVSHIKYPPFNFLIVTLLWSHQSYLNRILKIFID